MFLLLLPAIVHHAHAQYKIKGTVYDSTNNYVIQSVTVQSTSGKGAVTDANGYYEIDVAEKDSIWFSYLNKPTVKFPVLKIANPHNFEISLQVNVTTLKEVKVRPRNYRLDSLQNRQDYAKVFNYKKPTLSVVTPSYGQATGFDLNALIDMFRFRKNRNMQSFQRRLIQQEQDKYIDYRFSKALVLRLTGLTDSLRDDFMARYRPSYFFTVNVDEYTFQKFIKDAYERYQKGLPPLELWTREFDKDWEE